MVRAEPLCCLTKIICWRPSSRIRGISLFDLLYVSQNSMTQVCVCVDGCGVWKHGSKLDKQLIFREIATNKHCLLIGPNNSSTFTGIHPLMHLPTLPRTVQADGD